MSKTLSLYLKRLMTEEGENLLHLAGIIRRYSEGGWTKKKLQVALDMIQPGLGEISKTIDMDFNVVNVEELSKKSGIPLSELSVIAMVLNPQMYFPMDKGTVEISKGEGIQTDNYLKFIKGWRKFLKDHSEYADDFLDLYLVLFGKRDELMSDSSVVFELISMVKDVDFLSLNEKTVKDFRDIYDRLLPLDKEKVSNSINDPYVKGVLLKPMNTKLVVDGSNVAMVKSLYPDLENIFLAFKLIGKMKKVPWPFRIVFDANFIYKLRGSQVATFKNRFLKDPRISFHSPADERILEIATLGPSCILTNDRYLEYPKVRAIMLRFDGKRVWEDRKTA